MSTSSAASKAPATFQVRVLGAVSQRIRDKSVMAWYIELGLFIEWNDPPKDFEAPGDAPGLHKAFLFI
jgi:hypothetical protein